MKETANQQLQIIPEASWEREYWEYWESLGYKRHTSQFQALIEQQNQLGLNGAINNLAPRDLKVNRL